MMESDKLLEWNAATDEVKIRPVETRTSIELQSIGIQETKPRVIQTSGLVPDMQEETIETPYGDVLVAFHGNMRKPAIVTFHDIGLNYVTCFQGFFAFEYMVPLLRHFSIYHINAPGQFENAPEIKPEVEPFAANARKKSRETPPYATMDQLAEVVEIVSDHYNLKRIIGFGVGAGANILMRFAYQNPTRMNGLILVNPTCNSAGWVEWGYQKMNSWYLFGGHLTNFTEEYLLWHWFGKKTRWNNHDLVTVYKSYLKKVNVHNLALFIGSYIKRPEISLERDPDVVKKPSAKCIKCRTLLLAGDDSPHLDNVVDMNGKQNPEETDFMKIQDCGGMPLEEQPGKVCEAIKLFLQGMGYIPTLRHQSSIVAQMMSKVDLKELNLHSRDPEPTPV